MTIPVFIIGSGRCGTYSLYQMFDRFFPQVKAHHEYNIWWTQPHGALYYNHQSRFFDCVSHVRKTIERSVALCQQSVWLNAGNKMTWLIKPLKTVFPDARFVLLVRDGRMVCSSYYNKLRGEIYTDKGVRELSKFLDCEGLAPPSEKEYWWPLPFDSATRYHFYNDWNQFQRICWHWQQVNKVALEHKGDDFLMIRLEDLVKDKYFLKILLVHLRISFNKTDIDLGFDFLQKPRNVSEPKHYPLTEEQDKQFWKICGQMMEVLEYKREEEPHIVY